MSTAVRALIRGAWTEQFNQRWRFSRGKVGLWFLLLQAGSAALLLWRLAPAPPGPFSLPVATVAILAVVGGQVAGLLGGREQLYGRSVLRNLHISPAPGAGILTGLTLARLPGPCFSGLLVAIVASGLLPAGGLWWTLPVLWLLAAAAGLFGYAAALLALVAWVRLSPRSLALLWAVAVVVGFGMVSTLIGLLTLGLPVAVVLTSLRPAVGWVAGGISVLVGLPGVAMGAWLAVRPGVAGEWYREAYLRMQAWSDGRHRLRRSRWPRLLPGPAGALQARLWREIWLNWFTWVRFAFMPLCVALLLWRPNGLIRMARLFPIPVIMGFGLIAALGSLGELLATMGGSDGPNIGLSLVAGIRAGQVVRGKWVATLPLAVFSAACTWAVAGVAGQPGLRLGLAAGLIGLGFGVIAMAGGLFDLDPVAEVTEQEVPEILRAFLEQLPRQLGALIGYGGGIAFVAGAVWLCQRSPEAVLLVAAGCAAAAHLALVGGYLHLLRLGM